MTLSRFQYCREVRQFYEDRRISVDKKQMRAYNLMRHTNYYAVQVTYYPLLQVYRHVCNVMYYFKFHTKPQYE